MLPIVAAAMKLPVAIHARASSGSALIWANTRPIPFISNAPSMHVLCCRGQVVTILQQSLRLLNAYGVRCVHGQPLRQMGPEKDAVDRQPSNSLTVAFFGLLHTV